MIRTFKVWTDAHKGHNTGMINHAGKAHVYCLDCAVIVDIVAISATITPGDCCWPGFDPMVEGVISQPSRGNDRKFLYPRRKGGLES